MDNAKSEKAARNFPHRNPLLVHFSVAGTSLSIAHRLKILRPNSRKGNEPYKLCSELLIPTRWL